METLRSDTEWFRVDSESAAGAVRRAAVRLATRLGYTETRVAEVAIVASEATSNIWRHAGAGAVALQVVVRGEDAGLRLSAIDRGPGMADLRRSAADGSSTRGTLGVGIGAIDRLSSALDVSSHPGHGTVLVAELWPEQPPTGAFELAALTRPIDGEEECGDVVGARETDGHLVVLLADGLGHGPLAAVSARGALAAFHDSESTDPGELITRMHRAIGHTRGAAVAVASVDPAGELAFAGVGNISAMIDDGERRHAGLSQPGIVGHNVSRVRQHRLTLASGSLLVLHSDGMKENWNLRDVPGLGRRSAAAIAATLLRDAGTRPDDASVLVARRLR
ncbi:MAG TPA: SpoIIE family protein phosphatase [Jatrophihabitans sp.]|nr:SpoIIE family protein phosphatase [Jatrophihabitans sp.]